MAIVYTHHGSSQADFITTTVPHEDTMSVHREVTLHQHRTITVLIVQGNYLTRIPFTRSTNVEHMQDNSQQMEPDLNVDNIMKPVRAVPSTTILKSISW
jgi:hypothetical protein